MQGYFKADDIYELMSDCINEAFRYHEDDSYIWDRFSERLRQMPAITNLKPDVHGEWIEKHGGHVTRNCSACGQEESLTWRCPMHTHILCSACGKEVEGKTDFCPYCGADMRKIKKEKDDG